MKKIRWWVVTATKLQSEAGNVCVESATRSRSPPIRATTSTTLLPVSTIMEMIDNDHHQRHGSTSAAPNHGMTNFLRHFSQRNPNKDGSSSSSSQLKKSSRLLRHLGRNSTSHHHHQNQDTIISPVSDPGSAATTAFRSSRSKGKHFLTHRADHDEQDMITFDSDATRLGISPTCYDVVPAGKHANYGEYKNNHIDIEEEVCFLNNNVAAASSVTPLSSASVPNLFSSFPIWEETRPDDLYDSTTVDHVVPPHRKVWRAVTASNPTAKWRTKTTFISSCHLLAVAALLPRNLVLRIRIDPMCFRRT